MSGKNRLIQKIRKAFEEVEKPPAWCLSNSREGTEPAALEKEFSEVPDWEDLNPEFLDSAPDGFGSALSFFSDEAYRYYLPAYLVASVHEKLQIVDPVFYLTHGLDDSGSETLLNRRRYGTRTWRNYAEYRHSVFNREQASAINSYLDHELRSGNRTNPEKELIGEAIENYWRGRASGNPNG